MPQWLQALIIFLSALVLFRIEGKESIAMMRPGQVVVMIGIASILVEPIKSKSLLSGIYSGALLITLSILATFVHIYFPKTGRWLMGQPIVLIKNGEILHQNLKRARITEDDLKMRIRIEKISDVSTIKMGTLETSGRLGIELFPEDLCATRKEIDELKEAIQLISNKLNIITTIQDNKTLTKPGNNLFVQAENEQEQDPLQ